MLAFGLPKSHRGGKNKIAQGRFQDPIITETCSRGINPICDNLNLPILKKKSKRLKSIPMIHLTITYINKYCFFSFDHFLSSDLVFFFNLSS